MRVVYCAFESIFDHIFDSQVLFFLKAVIKDAGARDPGIKIQFLVLNSIRDFLRRNMAPRRREIRDFLRIKSVFSPKVPYFYKMPAIFKFSLYLNAVICLFALVFILRVKKSEKVVFHCRTEIVSYVILKLKKSYFRNALVICDARGVGSEEILYKEDLKQRFLVSKKIKEVEDFVYKNADYIFCVTKKFKEYIEKSNNIIAGRISVVPCCIDSGKFKFIPGFREEIRKELNINKKFAVVYSGSMNGWQLGKEMVEIFLVLKKKISNCFFLVFTRDIEQAETLFESYELKKEEYMILSKSYDDISKFLLAGDLALLIREKNIVNEVAFPVKFAEYVRCGMPVLTSISSDIKDIVETNEMGFILNDFNSKNEVESVAVKIKNSLNLVNTYEYKKNISEIIGELLSWEKYTGKTIDVYNKISADSQDN